jgi:hypothetical protein
MNKIKSFRDFLENAAVSASSTAGPGPVVSATVGSIPGSGPMNGSGDVSFFLNDKRRRGKKGNPSQVSDMRDLAQSKEVTHLKESDVTGVVIPRHPDHDPATRNMIDICLVELYDLDFELVFMNYDIQKHSVDLDDEETGYSSKEELTVSLNKNIQDIWHGNMIITGKFDESGTISTDILTLRGSGKSLNKFEQSLFDLVEEISQKLLGNLDYEKGSFRISFEVVGSAMPYAWSRNISVNVHFTLENNFKE